MSYKRTRFVREESWRYKRVKEAWRSPRGKTSRVRRSKEGWPPVVKIGYARPKSIRGRHPSGLTEVMVWRPKDLEHMDPKTQAARIAHPVGENKRMQILDLAKKANIRVLNPGVKKEPEVTPEIAAESTVPKEAQAETPGEAPVEAVTETTTEAPEAPAAVPEEDLPATEAEETKAAQKTPKKRKASKSDEKKRSKK